MQKPEVLYHGSPDENIEIFEPHVSYGSGEQFGKLVYATHDLATATIFLAQHKKVMSSGHFGGISYVLITDSREEFIKMDQGGCIYILPSETFTTEKGRGMGEFEWASPVPVKPIKKVKYPSALKAMLENEVQIYFIDDITYEAIKSSKDHGYSILLELASENQSQKIGIRPLDSWRSEKVS